MAYTGINLYKPGGRGELSADDYNYFQTQRRQITQQYNLGRAQNNYERNSARAAYNRMRADITRGFKNQVPQLMEAYAQRGLQRSGLYALGYDRFNAERNAQLGNLGAETYDRLGALGLADTQLGQVYRSGLDDLASASAARRASVAEELRRARQGF